MADDAAGGEDEEGVEVGEEGVVLEGQKGNPILRVQRRSPEKKEFRAGLHRERADGRTGR